MKSMVQNLPLQNIENRIVNHSTRKILAKKLKQNHHNPKSFLSMNIPEKQVRIPMTVREDHQQHLANIIDSKEPSGSIRNMLCHTTIQYFKIYRFLSFLVHNFRMITACQQIYHMIFMTVL